MSPFWYAVSLLVCLVGTIYLFLKVNISLKEDESDHSDVREIGDICPLKLRELLKANPVCLYGYSICIEDFKETYELATSTKSLCFLSIQRAALYESSLPSMPKTRDYR
ncbi:hypothetical protein Btru_043092 [Bulinus truncatus]|nr:hypothetical protein Btru_043092 [Bulinus truncatus]